MHQAHTSPSISAGDRDRLTFPVYIDAREVPAEAREVAALLADCSAALKDEPCVLGQESRRREPRHAVVLIRGQTAESIAVWVRNGYNLTSYRELKFGDRDAASERWRAAGLVVASMLLVPERGTKPPPTPEPEVQPAKDARPARAVMLGHATTSTDQKRIAVSLAATTGYLAPRISPLLGGALGVDVFPFNAAVGGSLSAEASVAPEKLAQGASVARQAVGFGIVAVLPLTGALRLTIRGQLLRERLAVAATNPGGSKDSGETWRTAGALALAPRLELTPDWFAFAGGQVALYDAAPRIVSGTTTLARTARVTGSAFVGIQVGF
ncbi:MAG: hypothetical protein SFV15_13755 [Polyangiaceae bacterium]|nr:hypothetical protein [Polyangiaceae bacterium]